MRGLAFALGASLAACGGDPAPSVDFRPLAASLSAWDEGAAAFAEGRYDAAAVAWSRARAGRGEDPLLGTWLARAWWRAGREADALALLDDLVRAHPGQRAARYDRGLLRCRAGDVTGGAEDVALAVQAGLLAPRDAARDRDLAPYLGHPAFSFLPRPTLEPALTLPEGASRVGADVVVRLDVGGATSGLSAPPLTLDAPGARGPARVARGVEDDVAIGGPGGERRRELAWTISLLGPGEVSIPRLELSQGAASAQLPGGAWRVTGEAGQGGDAPLELLLPSVVLGARRPPVAWIAGGALWVAAPSDARVQTEPAEVPADVRLSLRRDGLAVADLSRFPLASVQAVAVVRGPSALYRATVAELTAPAPPP